MAGRKALTAAEKAKREQERKAAAEARQRKLAKMTDDEKKAFVNAEKGERFKRLASARTAAILDKIEGLSKLSGSGYRYTQEQVDKIFKAISESAQFAYARFQPKSAGQKVKRTFEV